MKNYKSLLGVAIGTGVGAALGIVFSNFLIFIVAVGVGAGVGFALGAALTPRDKGGNDA